MRARAGLSAVAMAGAMLTAGVASALDASVDLSVQSAFIWRGMILNDKPVFQPSVTANAGAFSGTVWANMDLTADYGHQGEVNEVDYIVTYTRGLGPAELTLTGYAYTFPHTGATSTEEVWASVKLATFASPTLTVVRSVQAVQGWYVLLAVSHDLGLLASAASDGVKLTVNLGRATAEYTHGYFPDSERDHVTDYGARLDWPLKLGPGELKLNLQWTDFTEAHVESAGFEGRRAGFSGGAAYSFPL